MELATREDRSSKRKETLDLSYSALCLLPDLSRFSHVQMLRVDNNSLEDLDWRALMALKNLTNVNASNNRIKELPLYLAEWRTVRVLDLSFNRIDTIAHQLWPLFYNQIYAITLINKDRKFFMHSAEVTAQIRRYHGNGALPATWRHPIDDPNNDCCEFITAHVSEENWRYATAEKPRLRFEGNPAEIKMPRLALTDGWKELASEWRAQAEDEERQWVTERMHPPFKVGDLLSAVIIPSLYSFSALACGLYAHDILQIHLLIANPLEKPDRPSYGDREAAEQRSNSHEGADARSRRQRDRVNTKGKDSGRCDKRHDG